MNAKMMTTAELGVVALPAPDWAPARAVTELLRKRHSAREFSPRALSPEILSTLLWSAFGINRAATGGRTAPSAHDWRELDVYAVLAEGAYRYDPAANVLHLVRSGDLRAATGMQDFVGNAPLDLVYVANFPAMKDATGEERAFYAAADAGLVAQNVYLLCAATGLATVVRGLIDRRRLAAALGLALQQRIVLAQTVGYPAP
jgi:SagB-type dehydrogenase family enzyme